mmetsp:Transcript_58982/g.120804  ORF Transcript_58982/g.120804 Transcript_58982/m.120804 type:complete len:212 (-) Transcript_58982:827-1462(-)
MSSSPRGHAVCSSTRKYMRGSSTETYVLPNASSSTSFPRTLRGNASPSICTYTFTSSTALHGMHPPQCPSPVLHHPKKPSAPASFSQRGSAQGESLRASPWTPSAHMPPSSSARVTPISPITSFPWYRSRRWLLESPEVGFSTASSPSSCEIQSPLKTKDPSAIATPERSVYWTCLSSAGYCCLAVRDPLPSLWPTKISLVLGRQAARPEE